MGISIANYLPSSIKLDLETQNHVDKTFSLYLPFFHDSMAKVYKTKFDDLEKQAGQRLRDANLYFLGLQKSISSYHLMDDDELKIEAKKEARKTNKIIEEAELLYRFALVSQLKKSFGHGSMLIQQLRLIEKGIEEYGYRVGLSYARSVGVDDPVGDNNQTRKKRLVCKIWWDTKLVPLRDREFEELARRFGIVGRNQPYCSNITHNQNQARKEKSREIMSKKEAVCLETGDAVNMLEMLDGSIANPANKFAEIYTVQTGFENYAKENGHIGLMISPTLPGFKHAISDKFDGTKVREGQALLALGWNRCNTNFKDNGIYPYGFRVVECHKDGTPHWHIGIFIPVDKVEKVMEIARAEFLRIDPNEKGAQKHRVDFTLENPEEGRFSSYMFKYLSKAMEGVGVGKDLEVPEKDAKDTTPRVRSWASRFGVRGVQQVGGASIGVWRELRRCKDEQEGIIEKARLCANEGDWCGYFKLQGGHEKPRRQQPIKRLLVENIDLQTGEIKTNRYGDIVEQIKGIQCGDIKVITRSKTWEIRDIATDETEEVGIVENVQGVRAWEILPNVNPDNEQWSYQDPDLSEFSFYPAEGGNSFPWTINSNSRRE